MNWDEERRHNESLRSNRENSDRIAGSIIVAQRKTEIANKRLDFSKRKQELELEAVKATDRVTQAKIQAMYNRICAEEQEFEDKLARERRNAIIFSVVTIVVLVIGAIAGLEFLNNSQTSNASDINTQVSSSQNLTSPKGKTSQSITISSTEPNSSKLTATSYTVKSGDSLASIAKAFGISVEQLELWNDIDPSGLYHETGKPVLPGAILVTVQPTQAAQTSSSSQLSSAKQVTSQASVSQAGTTPSSTTTVQSQTPPLPVWKSLTKKKKIALIIQATNFGSYQSAEQYALKDGDISNGTLVDKEKGTLRIITTDSTISYNSGSGMRTLSTSDVIQEYYNSTVEQANTNAIVQTQVVDYKVLSATK